MLGMSAGRETEVKIGIGDANQILERLHAAGFQTFAKRIFEGNTLFDRNGNELRSARMLLRLRQAGDRTVLTWKGPGIAGPHKSRPEWETAIGSFDIMRTILEQLGYQATFRYEKFRTELKHPDHAEGVVTVDETPIGNFLELEGPGDWIDRTASDLGFEPEQYVLESYGTLYLKDCERRGVQPTNMVFSS
jgi:adenylate cyclase, class 2